MTGAALEGWPCDGEFGGTGRLSEGHQEVVAPAPLLRVAQLRPPRAPAPRSAGMPAGRVESAGRQYSCERAGCMNAPMIQSSGKKIPKKNIHPCPFRSVLRPSQTKRTIQMRAPKPIPHHMRAPFAVVVGVGK